MQKLIACRLAAHAPARTPPAPFQRPNIIFCFSTGFRASRNPSQTTSPILTRRWYSTSPTTTTNLSTPVSTLPPAAPETTSGSSGSTGGQTASGAAEALYPPVSQMPASFVVLLLGALALLVAAWSAATDDALKWEEAPTGEGPTARPRYAQAAVRAWRRLSVHGLELPVADHLLADLLADAIYAHVPRSRRAALIFAAYTASHRDRAPELVQAARAIRALPALAAQVGEALPADIRPLTLELLAQLYRRVTADERAAEAAQVCASAGAVARSGVREDEARPFASLLASVAETAPEVLAAALKGDPKLRESLTELAGAPVLEVRVHARAALAAGGAGQPPAAPLRWLVEQPFTPTLSQAAMAAAGGLVLGSVWGRWNTRLYGPVNRERWLAFSLSRTPLGSALAVLMYYAHQEVMHEVVRPRLEHGQQTKALMGSTAAGLVWAYGLTWLFGPYLLAPAVASVYLSGSGASTAVRARAAAHGAADLLNGEWELDWLAGQLRYETARLQAHLRKRLAEATRSGSARLPSRSPEPPGQLLFVIRQTPPEDLEQRLP